MNEQKWDEIATRFASGEQTPANGWDAWAEQATQESITIRAALPSSVEALLEVGCGVGRLTPYLALLFPIVIATDTSPCCRLVTRNRCNERRGVVVLDPSDAKREPADAALVWNLYDEEWTEQQRAEHLYAMRERYPIVLEGNGGNGRWAVYQRWSSGASSIRLSTGTVNVFEP